MTLTAVLTGLRPSALFGLHWSDLDFERQTVQINRSYYMGEFGMRETNRSRRTLLMAPVLSMAMPATLRPLKAKVERAYFPGSRRQTTWPIAGS